MRKIFSETMLVTKEAQKKFDINNVETDEEILARLMPFLIEKSQKYIGKKILIVTHGGLLRAFLSYVNYKVPKYSESPMRNAGYLKIESDGVDFKIIEEKLF